MLNSGPSEHSLVVSGVLLYQKPGSPGVAFWHLNCFAHNPVCLSGETPNVGTSRCHFFELHFPFL